MRLSGKTLTLPIRQELQYPRTLGTHRPRGIYSFAWYDWRISEAKQRGIRRGNLQADLALEGP